MKILLLLLFAFGIAVDSQIFNISQSRISSSLGYEAIIQVNDGKQWTWRLNLSSNGIILGAGNSSSVLTLTDRKFPGVAHYAIGNVTCGPFVDYNIAQVNCSDNRTYWIDSYWNGDLDAKYYAVKYEGQNLPDLVNIAIDRANRVQAQNDLVENIANDMRDRRKKLEIFAAVLYVTVIFQQILLAVFVAVQFSRMVYACKSSGTLQGMKLLAAVVFIILCGASVILVYFQGLLGFFAIEAFLLIMCVLLPCFTWCKRRGRKDNDNFRPSTFDYDEFGSNKEPEKTLCSSSKKLLLFAHC
jgi:hypothetical protein